MLLCPTPVVVCLFFQTHVAQVMSQSTVQDVLIHVNENQELVALPLPYLQLSNKSTTNRQDGVVSTP
jgi:hypothetical protein